MWDFPPLLLALMGFVLSEVQQIKALPDPYRAANVYPDRGSDVLRIFPAKGEVITIPLPRSATSFTFSPNGKSLYGIDASDLRRGLMKIEFNPTRTTLVPGTSRLSIRNFAVSANENKILISGSQPNDNGGTCGLFEVSLPGGGIRQLFNSNCFDPYSWNDVSLSPNGKQALATMGSNTNRDLHLELIDVESGTKRSLEGFDSGAWSPDGKWIAALKNRKLFLLDTRDLSRRRALGRASLHPEWSPDSRYLLLWKWHLFRCGFYLDVEPPATFEMFDIMTRKRSEVRSSRCSLVTGTTGWLVSGIQ